MPSIACISSITIHYTYCAMFLTFCGPALLWPQICHLSHQEEQVLRCLPYSSRSSFFQSRILLCWRHLTAPSPASPFSLHGELTQSLLLLPLDLGSLPLSLVSLLHFQCVAKIQVLPNPLLHFSSRYFQFCPSWYFQCMGVLSP